MIKKNKKDYERSILEPLIRYFKLPNDEIIPDESPDFIIRLNNHQRLGIEITSFYNTPDNGGYSLKSREELINEIITKSKYIYNARKYPLVSVIIKFKDDFIIGEKSAFIEKLAEFVKINYSPESNVTIDYYNDPDESIFSNIVDFVSISPLENNSKTKWIPVDSGLIPKLKILDIQALINKKNCKINSYREKCNIIWLVIFVGCYSLPTFVDLTDEILKRNYISEFDKTIILKHPNEVFELKKS